MSPNKILKIYLCVASIFIAIFAGFLLWAKNGVANCFSEQECIYLKQSLKEEELAFSHLVQALISGLGLVLVYNITQYGNKLRK